MAFVGLVRVHGGSASVGEHEEALTALDPFICGIPRAAALVLYAEDAPLALGRAEGAQRDGWVATVEPHWLGPIGWAADRRRCGGSLWKEHRGEAWRW